MKTTHTKGNWHFRTGESDNFCEIIGDYGTNKVIMVAPKDCFVNKSEAEANGRLVAAAPDLLKVCTDMIEAFVHKEGDKKGNQTRTNIFKYCPEFREIAVSARHAIEKATE